MAHEVVAGDLGTVDDDMLTSRNGADVCVFRPGFGTDQITDFELGSDVIRITGGPNDLTGFDFEHSGTVIIIRFGETEIVVEHSRVADLNVADNILFGSREGHTRSNQDDAPPMSIDGAFSVRDRVSQQGLACWIPPSPA